MAVLQQNKSKYIQWWTANAEVCAAKLCEWWQKGSNVSLQDFRWAKRYCLRHLGFGLNVALLTMKAIISTVLAQEETVGCMASVYIDNIYINEEVMPATHIREHLAQFGLECKDPEHLKDGAQELGLAVAIEQGELWLRQGSVVPIAPGVIMWWTVFFLSGKLLGHFPVCSWLHVACRILKGRTGLVMKGWDDKTKDALLHMVSGTMGSVQ